MILIYKFAIMVYDLPLYNILAKTLFLAFPLLILSSALLSILLLNKKYAKLFKLRILSTLTLLTDLVIVVLLIPALFNKSFYTNGLFYIIGFSLPLLFSSALSVSLLRTRDPSGPNKITAIAKLDLLIALIIISIVVFFIINPPPVIDP